MGLFDLSVYISAQQTQWIKRVLYAGCDNWREDLYNMTYGNPVILHPELVNKTEHPIISNIAESFVSFKKKFFFENENYKKSPIFYNPVIKRSRIENGILDRNFFVQNPPLNLKNIVKYQYRDIFENGPKLLETINNQYDLGLNLNNYLRLSGACSNFKSSLKNNRQSDGTCLDIRDFFRTFKKGSRGIRRIFSYTPPSDPKKLRNVITFCNITGTDLGNLDPNLIKNQLALWTD
jgi:hypothetical protein